MIKINKNRFEERTNALEFRKEMIQIQVGHI